MPKLWIVHRSPQQRVALARLAGVASADVVAGDPTGEAFAEAAPPDAVLLALEGDFELELEFVHRHRERCARARWLLVCRAPDVADARRLFAAVEPEIVVAPPTARSLRAQIAAAAAHRAAAGLAERRQRERIAERFSAWLGGVEVAGLLRALDPSLARLPLLVRGRPGSGRSLLCHYVELYRGAPGRTLRLHARDLADVAALPRRLARDPGSGASPIASIWIDEIDRLPISAQSTLAEWIVHGIVAADVPPEPVRWIATAGPAGLSDTLEPGLEQAFAPLVVEVPALADHPERFAPFVEEVVRDWTRTVGGPPRRFAPSALEALRAHPWSGDRAELEAVLRTTLAATARESIEDVELRFPTDPTDPTSPEPPGEATREGGSAAAGPAERAASDPIPALIARPDEMEAYGHYPGDLSGDEADEAPWPAAEPPPVASVDMDALPPVEPEASDATAKLPPVEPEASDAAAEPAPAPPEESEAAAESPPAPAHGDEAPPGPSWGPGTEQPPPPRDAPDESERLAMASFEEARHTSSGRDPDTSGRSGPGDAGWRRLARSLSHEIRNPLVSIRTFAELLPEHFDDETFRSRFTELVGRDVAHISDVLSRLSRIAEREKTEPESVDVSQLIESLLEERRARITRGRLLVLRELERDRPFARADAEGLRIALAGLLDRALESLPERGDLFLATRWIERSADGRAKLRVLLRHHDPTMAGEREVALEELEPTANLLEYVLAEAVVEACGGSLTIDSTDGGETLILIELPTPG